MIEIIVMVLLALGTNFFVYLTNKKTNERINSINGNVIHRAQELDIQIRESGKYSLNIARHLEVLDSRTKDLLEAKRWTFNVVDLPDLSNISEKHVKLLHQADPERFGDAKEFTDDHEHWVNRALTGCAVSPAQIAHLRRLTLEDIHTDEDLAAEFYRQKSNVKYGAGAAKEED